MTPCWRSISSEYFLMDIFHHVLKHTNIEGISEMYLGFINVMTYSRPRQIPVGLFVLQ